MRIRTFTDKRPLAVRTDRTVHPEPGCGTPVDILFYSTFRTRSTAFGLHRETAAGIQGNNHMPRRYFLAKTDPQTYWIDDLEREKRTVWDGVRNPQALRAVREMRPGDRVFVYHSQEQAGVVGMAEVASEPRPDPANPKLAVVDFAFLFRLGSAGAAAGNQGERPVRGLGPGAAVAALHHGGAGQFRGMDAEAVPGREDLNAAAAIP